MRARHHVGAVGLALAVLFALILLAPPGARSLDRGSFVNWESPHVHPLDLSPDGTTLAAVNTAASRLEIFDVAGSKPVLRGSVFAGLDPVSVRFRTDDEAWVVNHISDSVSIIDVSTLRVRATLEVDDEPTDVVFAGNPERAFVSCSQVNRVLVFNPTKLDAKPRVIEIDAEDPRAMAVSPDGDTVYVAVFESGNGSTSLGGGLDGDLSGIGVIPLNVVSDPEGPYDGQNPPPNSGSAFEPRIASGLPPPPPVAMIVKKNDTGRWLDDNAGDWTELVSGSLSQRSGRPRGWDVIDRDVAIIDATSLKVSYVDRLMNANMALAINPVSGDVVVVGTDGTNEVRFEPVLNGRFLRVNAAIIDGAGRRVAQVVDLNPHLDYTTSTIATRQRELSIGDPRAIVWSADGTQAWVAGMGSNNLVRIDAGGTRLGSPVEVGQGPTGLALDLDGESLYVLNRFSATISVVDTPTGRQAQRVALFDPTPSAIKKGRPFLYDTHATSGLGHVACASCHLDARTDRLAWDLGAPDGSLKTLEDQNTSLVPLDEFMPWHPMKGPMTTQTLQDIIGMEPHHWRGDRDGIEEFNDAFVGLLGDNKRLTRKQMQQFEDFLATISIPPNPFREIDNSLPPRLVLDGHYRTGRFGGAGQRLPAGNARRGLTLFQDLTRGLDGGLACATCHTLPTGAGTPFRRVDLSFEAIPVGPRGEQHLALIGNDASVQRGFKVPQLRTLYDKVGMTTAKKLSRSGFGVLHDGSVDSVERFISAEVFGVQSDQEVADLVALMLAFSGSDLPASATTPPGSLSNDTHAAVGRQATIRRANGQRKLIASIVALADAGVVELIAKSLQDGVERGWVYDASRQRFLSDSAADDPLTLAALKRLAASGSEVTFTCVPSGSGVRLGIDRDVDGQRNFDEPGARRAADR